MNPVFLINLAIMTLLWITVSFCFYLMGFYLSNMEGDVNENSLFQGIGMIISFLVAAPIITKLGYRRSFLLFFALAALSAMLYISIPNKSPLFIACLVFLGRFGICPCYSLTFISSNELFPARIKSSLFAFCNILARALCMGAPLVAGMRDPIPF